MRSRNRYGGYRGRRTGRNVLNYIIVVLLLLIVVMAALLLLGQGQPMQDASGGLETEQPQQPEQGVEAEPESHTWI